MNVVIILPTYNEKGNIGPLLDALLIESYRMPHISLSILVVDDSSPDGTAEVVKSYTKRYPNIFLLTGKKEGLGIAYIRGFKYALSYMSPDILFKMDADFFHDPRKIPEFINKILEGNDLVIGSRYVKGGSLPLNWSLLRRLNSKGGNLLARYVTGLSHINDCTSGFRAIRATALRAIDLDSLKVKGYGFMISILYHASRNGAKVTEIPIQVKERTYGKSKLTVGDIFEFISNVFLIRFSFLSALPSLLTRVLFAGITLALLILTTYFFVTNSFMSILILFITLLSLFMIAHSIFNIFIMIFAWEDIERIENNKSPQEFIAPLNSFTALIPVRHETKVIRDTINAISQIDYPENLKEAIVICKTDDIYTIDEVRNVISSIGKPNIKLVLFNDLPINKPHALNIGLQYAQKDTVVVFDAEDQPHKDIYHIANTILIKEKADVVQSGVQLMNFKSNWFSALNVLEYFFWFKSSLHFFAAVGLIPLGGNTVFFKTDWLRRIGGWDDNCLTEDADIGIRLSLHGAKIKIVYDERHVTKEETPSDTQSFIKQRTRWNQGFIHVFSKGEWLKLPYFSQRLLAAYILLSPLIQATLFILTPFSIITALELKLPLLTTMLATTPLFLLVLQLIIYNIGLYEFTKEYKYKYPILMPFRILLSFYPFQFALGFSAFRAFLRFLRANNNWEKTQHINAHREGIDLTKAYAT